VESSTFLGEGAFVDKALKKEMQAQNYAGQSIVFVHGYNVRFVSALYRTAQIAHDLNFDGPVFLYSWPSSGTSSDYTYDSGSVEQAEAFFESFLTGAALRSSTQRVNIIAHSMGNRLVLRVLEKLSRSSPAQRQLVNQIILAAPDVDVDTFRLIAARIAPLARGVTMYASSEDAALRLSQTFWGGVARAGFVTDKGPVIVTGIDTIDASATSTAALAVNHSGYAESAALLADISLLIDRGQRPPFLRNKVFKEVVMGDARYWKY
jgi:esterase/lipase superfamily enzyme